ncbi:MAG TPA: BrnA antitoxin family protein [Terriglobia bacterium]|nr:BrnA antitoxin family protein [Terriglobia bacterium]
MNAARTGKTSRRKAVELRTDWKRLRSMTDQQVHAAVTKDPDIDPTDAAFWSSATLVMPRPKQTITIRLDADLLEWLRGSRGYQTRINAILRAYMDAQRGRRRGSPHR